MKYIQKIINGQSKDLKDIYLNENIDMAVTSHKRKGRVPQNPNLIKLYDLNIGSEYNEEQVEMLRALEKYRSKYQLAYLTLPDFFFVLVNMGYRKTNL